MFNERGFLNDLLDKILIAISEGCTKILIIGTSTNTIRLLADLNKKGLLKHIKGIIDENVYPIDKSLFDINIYSFNHINNIDYDAVVIPFDREKEDVLNKFMEFNNKICKIIICGSENYDFNDVNFETILKSCTVEPKSGGNKNMLIHIYQSLKYLSQNKKYGDVVEFGVFQGGTTVFIAKVLKHFGNPSKIYGFDTFSGFPPPKSSLDMFDDAKYQRTNLSDVERYCSPYNIELIKGDICETCECLKDKTISFAFFDTDNYSATKKALETCYELIIPGGILAFDHYYSPSWIQTLGERMAIKQVLNDKPVFSLHESSIFLKLE